MEIDAQAVLTNAVRHALESCDGTGRSLPVMLRSALEVVGREVGGTAGLVRHDPSTRAAEQVCRLASLADYQLVRAGSI